MTLSKADLKADARRQSSEQVAARRMLVAQLHQAGVPVMSIVRQSGLNWATVSKLLKKIESGDPSALMSAPRGRKRGQGRALSALQEIEIKQCIRNHGPWYYKLEDALWTRDTVARLIQSRCQVSLSTRAVTNYLVRWGIGLKEPAKPPYARCAKPVQKWLDENYRSVRSDAMAANAEVLWLNSPIKIESAQWFGLDTPVLAAATPRPKAKRMSLISAITVHGTLLWKVIGGTFTLQQQIKFINNLKKDVRRKLILIRSHDGIYASDNFWDWMEAEDRRIDIYPPVKPK